MRYRVNRRTGDRISEIGGAFCGMMCLEVGIWLN